MADRGLIEQLTADGLSKDEAQWAADKVGAAIVARVRAGRTVQIEGFGRLGSRVKVKDCYHDGPGRVQVTVACLKQPAEFSRGQSWNPGKAA